ncbi:MAG: alpha/beta hydrolase [Rhodospirillales bacterium]|nr:MAG: alpha/beta hydrolase [Rhodospirillales bacterium]
MKTPRSTFGGGRAGNAATERIPAPTDEFLDLDLGRIAVRRLWYPKDPRPDGPVLVFLHEALGCNDMWKRWPGRLAGASSLPFVAYDRFGHGSSDPLPGARGPDYLDIEAYEVLPRVLDAMGISDPILFGHSDGGSIALLYAARFPVRAVITEAAHVFVEEVTRAGIRAALAAWRMTDLPDRLARYHGDKTEALFFAWAETWLSEPFGSWNIERCLPRITCPVLAVQGADDEYGTARQVESIVSSVSGRARALMLPDCRHIPHQQAADRLLPHVAAFVDDCLD